MENAVYRIHTFHSFIQTTLIEHLLLDDCYGTILEISQ